MPTTRRLAPKFPTLAFETGTERLGMAVSTLTKRETEESKVMSTFRRMSEMDVKKKTS